MNFIFMLLNEQKISILKFALIIYDFYKTNINNEKLLKESLFNVLKSVEKLLKELIVFVIISDLLIEIRKKYEDDNVI